MELIALNPPANLNQDPKLQRAFTKFESLLAELRQRGLPSEIIRIINSYVEPIHQGTLAPEDSRKLIKKQQALVIKLLEAKLKIVPKKYYQNIWTPLGMTVYGLPIGMAFGMSLGNMGLLAIGLPIGLAVGIAMGTTMDSKAAKEGRQLAWESK